MKSIVGWNSVLNGLDAAMLKVAVSMDFGTHCVFLGGMKPLGF